MKHIISTLMLLACLTASAEDFTYEYEGQTLTYTILDKEAKTCEVKSGRATSVVHNISGDLTIPSIAKKTGRDLYTVINIGDNAFYGNSGMTSVHLPSSLRSIGEDAFWGCSQLTSVVIPESVEEIGEHAFRDCAKMKSIDIPKSLKKINKWAFYGCRNLNSVNIHDVAAWCNIVFEGNYSNPMGFAKSLCLNDNEIINLVIPNSVTKINSQAFDGCNNILSVDIPSSVKEIYSLPTSLTSINIHDIAAWCNVVFFYAPSMPHNLLVNGELITNLVIPNSVTKINSQAFCNCRNIISVDIPNSVSEIESGAFSLCTNLTSIVIPNSVVSINGFDNCTGLTSVTIPQSVNTIEADAFNNCSKLKKIIIGENVKFIGRSAFTGCPLEEIISLPLQAPEVYYDSFYKLWAFDQSTFENALLIYNNGDDVDASYAEEGNAWCNFYHYQHEDLSEYYNDGTTTIEKATYNVNLYGTVQLKASVTDIANPALSWVSLNNDVATVDKNGLVVGTGTGETDIYVVIKNYPRKMGICHVTVNNPGIEYSFNKETMTAEVIGVEDNVSEISIPATIIYNSQTYTVTSIEEKAFFHNRTLTSVEIPKTVTIIRKGTFQECYGLSSVKIPETVTTIEEYAFEHCYSLTHVEIPKAVTTIEGHTFANCTGLTLVGIPGTITTIGEYAFENCSKLTYIDIPETVTTMGAGAFRGCSGLTIIKIPRSMTTIGAQFAGCSGVTWIYIPETITYIAERAFSDSRKLQKVYSYNPIPPTIYTSAFSNYETAILYVPYESVEAYKNAKCWEWFYNIQGYHFSTGIADVEADNEKKENVYYDISGRRLAKPQKGLNIINGKKVIIK